MDLVKTQVKLIEDGRLITWLAEVGFIEIIEGTAVEAIATLKQPGQERTQADDQPFPKIKRTEKNDHHPFPCRIKGARKIDHGIGLSTA